MKIRHNCKDNDNHIIMEWEDGDLDSLLIGDSLEKSWTVIGFNDLKDALYKAGFSVVKKKNG